MSKNLTRWLHMQLQCNRFLAAARCKLWWMTPEWGSRASDLTPETQFLLLELKEGGPYAILLPLIDRDTFRGTLRPPGCALVRSEAPCPVASQKPPACGVHVLSLVGLVSTAFGSSVGAGMGMGS